MNNSKQARKDLDYVDPAGFTPHFVWKTQARSREVYCEGVALAEIAKRFGTPTYVYSRRAIEEAFDELKSGLGRLPHLLCFAVKANGNLSILSCWRNAEAGSTSCPVANSNT